MTECLTISGVAMRIFLTKYYNPNKEAIPLITNKAVFDDIHSAYYGGRVEVYNPIINMIAYYYDVNSLYPSAMRQPMPYERVNYYKDMSNIKLDNFFGFCLAEIETPKNIFLLLKPLVLNLNI